MLVDDLAKTMTPYHALWYYILKDVGANTSKIQSCWNFWDMDSGLFAYKDKKSEIMRYLEYGALDAIEALKNTFNDINEFNDINLPLRASNTRIHLDAPLDWSLRVIRKFEGDKSLAVLDMFLCYFEDLSEYKEIIKLDMLGSRIVAANHFLNYGVASLAFVKSIVESTVDTRTGQDPSWAAVNLFKRYGKSAPVKWAKEVIRKDNIGSPLEASMCLYHLEEIEEDFLTEMYQKEILTCSPLRKDYVINQYKKQILER